MAPPTFIQKSRLGQVIFQIREGALYLSASRQTGGFDEYCVDLRQISSDYKPRSHRVNFMLGLAGGFLVLSCLALWGLYRQTLIPREAIGYFTQWPIYGIGISLFVAIQYSRRIEYFQFSNHWGKPVVTVIREREQAAECEAFVLTLVSHIELAQSDLTAGDRELLLQKLARENLSPPVVSRGLSYWKFSLVLGVLAAGIPWVPGLAYYLDVLHFMLIFWLCAGGAICCVFSYTTKESRRHWSLLGLILSLIPPYFY